MIIPANKIIVALDVDTMDDAIKLASKITNKVGMFKIGSEMFTRYGPSIIEEIGKYNYVMLDLKLHDIPNTISRTTKVINLFNFVRFITIHSAGSTEMIKAAVKEAKNLDVIGVTVLTSMNESDHILTKVDTNILNVVLDRARLCIMNGCSGVVASPAEVVYLRDILPKQYIITPGIRLEESDDDQKRKGSPYQAIRDGASFLVIGRPITQAKDPIDVINKITSEIIKGIKDLGKHYD